MESSIWHSKGKESFGCCTQRCIFGECKYPFHLQSNSKAIACKTWGQIWAADTHTLRIPQVFHYGELSNGAFLIMEHIQFGGRSSQEQLGRGLAQMHLAPLKVEAQRLVTPSIEMQQASCLNDLCMSVGKITLFWCAKNWMLFAG